MNTGRNNPKRERLEILIDVLKSNFMKEDLEDGFRTKIKQAILKELKLDE